MEKMTDRSGSSSSGSNIKEEVEEETLGTSKEKSGYSLNRFIENLSRAVYSSFYVQLEQDIGDKLGKTFPRRIPRALTMFRIGVGIQATIAIRQVKHIRKNARIYHEAFQHRFGGRVEPLSASELHFCSRFATKIGLLPITVARLAGYPTSNKK
jgi:hypothetical protein